MGSEMTKRGALEWLKEWAGVASFIAMVFIAGGTWAALQMRVATLEARVAKIETASINANANAALVKKCVELSERTATPSFGASNADVAMLRLGCDRIMK